jgi:hypothetical protein
MPQKRQGSHTRRRRIRPAQPSPVPDADADEDTFAVENAMRGLQFTASNTIPQLRSTLESLQRPGTRDRSILKLLNEIGLEAIAPLDEGLETGRALSRREEIYLRDSLRALVRKRIASAYAAARLGETVAERKAAREFLRKVGSALAGDGRGVREARVTDYLQVRAYYYRMVYRLHKALAELREHGVSFAPDSGKLAEVAASYGIEARDLRVYLFTDSGLLRQTFSVEAQARIWTARRFRPMTEGTVSNILAKRRL